MDKIQKFLEILADIRAWKIKTYDVKPLKGHKGVFRLRKGRIRIVFAKGEKIGIVINIDYRKDVYKNF
ncbi:MAG: hypothetical protein AAB606_05425 [Patescibacteria group bacterium]